MIKDILSYSVNSASMTKKEADEVSKELAKYTLKEKMYFIDDVYERLTE